MYFRYMMYLNYTASRQTSTLSKGNLMSTRTPEVSSRKARKPKRNAAPSPRSGQEIRWSPLPPELHAVAISLTALFAFPDFAGAELLSAEKTVTLLDETVHERCLKRLGLKENAKWLADQRCERLEKWIEKLTERKDEANAIRLRDGESPHLIASLDVEWTELSNRLRAIIRYAFATGQDVKDEALRIGARLTDAARCARPLPLATVQ